MPTQGGHGLLKTVLLSCHVGFSTVTWGWTSKYVVPPCLEGATTPILLWWDTAWFTQAMC